MIGSGDVSDTVTAVIPRIAVPSTVAGRIGATEGAEPFV